ncbi:MAG: cell division protein PerM, partial [Actinomycetes bacterium]
MATSTTAQPTRPPGPRGPRRPPGLPPARPLTLSGVLAAARSAGLGALAVMVLVLVGWATTADTGASAPTAVTAGLQIWLVGHGTNLALRDGSFSLVPLGLSALPFVLVHSATFRAGTSAQVRSRRGVIALASS